MQTMQDDRDSIVTKNAERQKCSWFQHVLNEVRGYVPAWGQEFIDRAFEGDVEAAGSLAFACHDNQRVKLVRDAFDTGMPKAAFREILERTLTQSHHYDLARIYRSRALVVRWCRYAEFPIPDNLPERVLVYRGARDMEVKEAVKRLPWTLDYDMAAWFATQRAVTGGLPPKIIVPGFVLKAVVPRNHIVFYSDERTEKEVFLFRPPRSYSVVEGSLNLPAGA